MKLDENIVIAEFDGGRIVLIVDPNSKCEGSSRSRYARDLYGNDEYVVDLVKGTKYDGKPFYYWLDFKYFEVAKTGELRPLYLEEKIMEKYNLSYGSEVDNETLLNLEIALDKQEENKLNQNKSKNRKK